MKILSDEEINTLAKVYTSGMFLPYIDAPDVSNFARAIETAVVEKLKGELADLCDRADVGVLDKHDINKF